MKFFLFGLFLCSQILVAGNIVGGGGEQTQPGIDNYANVICYKNRGPLSSNGPDPEILEIRVLKAFEDRTPNENLQYFNINLLEIDKFYSIKSKLWQITNPLELNWEHWTLKTEPWELTSTIEKYFSSAILTFKSETEIRTMRLNCIAQLVKERSDQCEMEAELCPCSNRIGCGSH